MPAVTIGLTIPPLLQRHSPPAAQSSGLSTASGLSSNSAGFYLSPRAGVDYQMTKRLGLRGEFIYSTLLAGSGHLTMIFLGGGLYYSIGG